MAGLCRSRFKYVCIVLIGRSTRLPTSLAIAAVVIGSHNKNPAAIDSPRSGWFRRSGRVLCMSALYRSAVRAVRISLLEPVVWTRISVFSRASRSIESGNRLVERAVYSFIPKFALVDLLLCKSKRPVMSPWLRRESHCSHLVHALRVLRAVPV